MRKINSKRIREYLKEIESIRTAKILLPSQEKRYPELVEEFLTFLLTQENLTSANLNSNVSRQIASMSVR